MFKTIAAAALMIAALYPFDVLAQEMAAPETEASSIDLGAPIGSQAPLEWILQDQTGEERSFADLAGPNGLILFFNRSLDWCGYCKTQTRELEANYDAFSGRGYGVAVLTHDPYTVNARFAADNAARTVLLSDPDNAVIDAFDVRDPVYAGRSGRFDGLPYPITFVIGPDGKVLDKFWHEPTYGDQRGYRMRVEMDEIFAGLDALVD